MRKALRFLFVLPVRAYFRHVRQPLGKRLVWRVASHTWWLEEDETVTTSFGATMHVNCRDIVGRYISYFGVWEPNLTAWLHQTLKPGDVFVDVGANVGYFSLLASKVVGPTGSVIAIEPVPDTARILRENIALNAATNVRVVEEAAWHETTSLDIFCSNSQTTGTATTSLEWAERWGVNERRVKVRAARLSDLLTRGELERCRIIKIDVEGAELSALAGLPLDRCEAAIVVEVAPALIGGAEALFGRMASHGYRSRILENDYSPAAYWRNESHPVWRDSPRPGADQFDVVFER